MPLPPAPTARASRLRPESTRWMPSDDTESEASSAAPQALLDEAPPVVATAPRKHSKHPASAPAAPARKTASASPVSRRMRKGGPTKLFVLDTNVLMHDPMSLFRFEEHDIFLPMVVLEELDSNKKGMTEVARNARQASRTLDALAATQGADMSKGLPLDSTGHLEVGGKLFFQTQALDLSLPLSLPFGVEVLLGFGLVEASLHGLGLGSEPELALLAQGGRGLLLKHHPLLFKPFDLVLCLDPGLNSRLQRLLAALTGLLRQAVEFLLPEEFGILVSGFACGIQHKALIQVDLLLFGGKQRIGGGLCRCQG